MGSGESKTRKVSFGVDDEDRVRILRGVKLSEDVLQRMKGVANLAPEKTALTTTNTQKVEDVHATPVKDSQPMQTPPASPQSNKQDEQKRFEEQQQFLKDELSKVSQKEAVMDELAKARSKEKLQTRREAEKAKLLTADDLEVMAQKLQKKDSQLKALEAFYKAQIAQLEKRNREEYDQSKDQFHQAASETEKHVRACNTEPVCTGLQAEILSCYRDNKDQTLRCSDLAKEYMKCIQAAKKNLMVNRG